MGIKRREFIQAVVAVGLGSRVAAAGNQSPPISLENPGIRRQTLGRTGAQVSVLALGGVIGRRVTPKWIQWPSPIAQ